MIIFENLTIKLNVVTTQFNSVDELKQFIKQELESLNGTEYNVEVKSIELNPTEV